MGYKNEDLRTRTKRFALSVVQCYTRLPKTTESQVLGKQMLRCGTSVGAHYREAHRAKSDADFISKIEGGLQELDETTYWLELLVETGICSNAYVQPLTHEADELIAIFVTLVKNTKLRKDESSRL